MKKLFTLSVLGLTSMQIFSQTTIARWNFEGVTTSNTGSIVTVSAGSAVADSGAKVTGSSFTGFHATPTTVWSNPGGNGSTKSVSSNNWNVSDYYQFSASTAGYSGISISFDQIGSATGPANFKIQYSTDGILYNDFTGNTYNTPSNGTTAIAWSGASAVTTSSLNFNLATISSLNNASNVYFKIIDNGTASINAGTTATSGTSRIDNFYITAATALPVSLTSLSASIINNQPIINWQTSTEVNFNYFGVEKSLNAQDFIEIGKVNSNKAANGSNYQFADLNKTLSNQFYRLKMVDDDGTFKYSNVVAVNGKAALQLAIYPNPVTNTIILSHQKAVAGALLKIIGINGRTLSSNTVATGATQTSIDVTKLVKGNYVLTFVNNGEVSTIKMIK